MITIPGQTWQWVFVGLDAAVLYLLKRWYNSKVQCAEEIEALQCYKIKDIGNVLQNQPDSKLPYACVEGVTYALEKPINSQFSLTDEGVLHHILFVEHKSKRTNGYWSDVKNIIKERTRVCNFALVDPDHGSNHAETPILVEVADPLSADFLMESLTTTYDQFTPNSDTLISRGIDRIFGEVSKGYQETEKMLHIGARLLGIGQLVLSDGKIVLESPSGNKRFILSTLSKKMIVKNLKSDARLMKIFMWILGLVGAGMLAYLLQQVVRQWYDKYKMDQLVREVRRQKESRRPNSQWAAATASAVGDQSDEDEDNSDNCVICLQNSRDVVILECGHVCLCIECAQALPEPRKCPICRGHVSRYVVFYRP